MPEKTAQTQNAKGFTLIEVIVAVTIFTLLMLAVNLFFVSLYRQQGANLGMAQRIESVNIAMSALEKEIRECNNGEDGAFALVTVTEFNLAFFNDIDSDGFTEKVSYYLDGTDLKKSITQPGSLPYYSGAAITSVVLKDVRNGGEPIFTYYDDTYSGTGDPLSSFVPNDVKLIGISLTVNSANGNNSYPLHTETKVQMRNL